MTGEELRKTIFSKGVRLKDVADKVGISPQALQSRLSVKNVRSDYASEIIKALKELTDGDICIQTNKNGDNNFKAPIDKSFYVAKVAGLEERVKYLCELLEEKERLLADKERTINILMNKQNAL